MSTEDDQDRYRKAGATRIARASQLLKAAREQEIGDPLQQAAVDALIAIYYEIRHGNDSGQAVMATHARMLGEFANHAEPHARAMRKHTRVIQEWLNHRGR